MSHTVENDRIDGTRITVWDVFLYLEDGLSPEQIADVLPLSVSQVQAAIEFIDRNREYVLGGHRKIEERNARGNPPEIEEKLVKSRARMEAWRDEHRKEDAGARASG
ncbi:MAG: DUF433 domain-containing protein [Planctomycetota bacterium]|nr:MAG: DUF433 domain-containing protein [Planctomycetota bacterium]REJ91464.1 MAG: DUF433 domain-containing protein [Planctomycetota bacterium]REK25572.1 MAG: DUF433 domain-containing protein [Planctomycetota bacterium]REK31716.1 MAG: DUF433 domain-containing protein [Planctomycetota bacterium]